MKTLVKFNPVRSLRRTRDIDSLFSDFFNWRSPFFSMPDAGWSPRIDVHENDKEYVLHSELPGIARKDIELTFRDDVLTLKGEKKRRTEDEKENYAFAERSYGAFERSFRFAVPVQDDNIKAVFKNGVLTVTVPKAPEPEPTKVAIK